MSRAINIFVLVVFLIIGFIVFADASTIKVETVFHQIYVAVHWVAILVLFVSGCIVLGIDGIMYKINKLNENIASKKDLDRLYEALRNVEKVY